MSGDGDVAVVWLAEAGASSASPSDDARRALAGWARARGVALVFPGDAPLPPDVDLGVGERVERELERAREAIAGLDADAAERALARAEGDLRAHPELPHAAWLRAEVSRAWSSRFLRIEPRDEARARAAWQDADALDGGRVAGVGETAFPPRPLRKTSFLLRGGSGARTVVRLDGRPLSTHARSGGGLTADADVAPGEHQVVVAVDEQTVLASWLGVAAGAAPALVELHVPTTAACTSAAMSALEREGDHIRAPGVGCPHWVAVVPAPRAGGILVARCERDACGPLLEWRTESLPVALAPSPYRSTWPSWATWVLVGAVAATAGTVGLVATGALEQRPSEPRFVAGGVRNE